MENSAANIDFSYDENSSYLHIEFSPEANLIEIRGGYHGFMRLTELFMTFSLISGNRSFEDEHWYHTRPKRYGLSLIVDNRFPKLEKRPRSRRTNNEKNRWLKAEVANEPSIFMTLVDEQYKTEATESTINIIGNAPGFAFLFNIFREKMFASQLDRWQVEFLPNDHLTDNSKALRFKYDALLNDR
jgi:hypothetical protein